MPTDRWRIENADRMRAYRTGWYQRNRTAEIAKAAERMRRYRERNTEIIRQAKNRPCTDCSIQYPYYVMHFDHLGEEDKDGRVGAMAWRPVSEKRLRAEMAKCEVVCQLSRRKDVQTLDGCTAAQNCIGVWRNW